MKEIGLINADAEAFGHPTECTEPATGTVVSDSSHGISVTANGVTREVATIASATISVPSHSHDYDTTDGCHDDSAHSLDPDSGEPSITIDGSAVYLIEDGVTTDPITGGDVDITDNEMTTGITYNG